MKVRIFGQLDFYAPTGRLGLKMAGIDPRFTLGELSQARDQVVRALVASGLFDANRARRLSPIPLRVGVVASVGSAAWHDFRDELDRSGFGFDLAVCDTRVQGEWAVPMVAAAIRTLTRRGDLDCVVVIRGGGARNELATFDAESIAVAIATSPVPVLTGLGHEVDRSVADEVAHTALKTPTACAGALIDAVHDYLAATERCGRDRCHRPPGPRHHHRCPLRSGPPHRPAHARRRRARRRAARHTRRTRPPGTVAPGRSRPTPAGGRRRTPASPRAAAHRRRAASSRWARRPAGAARPDQPVAAWVEHHARRRRHPRAFRRRRVSRRRLVTRLADGEIISPSRHRTPNGGPENNR